MIPQTKVCLIWCSEPHSLLAKASSSPTSCGRRGHYCGGHYCVSNRIIFILLSPSPSPSHRHHYEVTTDAITAHGAIIVSSSAPSPSSRHHQHHHHRYHRTSSPVSHQHQHRHLHPFIPKSTIVPITRHHHQYRIISTITLIPSSPASPSSLSQDIITSIASASAPSASSLHPHPHHHHHQHRHHYPIGSESPWRVIRAFSTDLKGLCFLFSSSQKDSHLTDVSLWAVEHPWCPENKEKWWPRVLVRQPPSGLKTNRSGLSLLRGFLCSFISLPSFVACHSVVP